LTEHLASASEADIVLISVTYHCHQGGRGLEKQPLHRRSLRASVAGQRCVGLGQYARLASPPIHAATAHHRGHMGCDGAALAGHRPIDDESIRAMHSGAPSVVCARYRPAIHPQPAGIRNQLAPHDDGSQRYPERGKGNIVDSFTVDK
jgi:hypothetical protein